MTNPYAPPPIVIREDRKFRLTSSVRSSTSFMKVGLVCAFISGVILEITVANFPFIASIWAMPLPGLVLGIGVFYATRRNVSHARRVGLFVFPFIALSSFALMGMMYDAQPRLMRGVTALEFSSASFPGVLLLAGGCLLIARPRSYARFFAFVGVTTVVAGIGPFLAFDPPLLLAMFPRYLLIMLFAQAVMFGMIGWIFGDTISDPATQHLQIDHDSEARQA